MNGTAINPPSVPEAVEDVRHPEPAGFALEFRESGRPSVSRLAIQRFVQSAPSS